MAKIRFALRGTATVLMGKNTMMRKIISLYIKDNPGHPFEQASNGIIVGIFLLRFMGSKAVRAQFFGGTPVNEMFVAPHCRVNVFTDWTDYDSSGITD